MKFIPTPQISAGRPVEELVGFYDWLPCQTCIVPACLSGDCLQYSLAFDHDVTAVYVQYVADKYEI